MLLTVEKMKKINDSMPPEAKYGDVFLKIAEAQLNHVVSRPCKECYGEEMIRKPHRATGFKPGEDYIFGVGCSSDDLVDCPTCKGSGSESKTIQDIVEEWSKGNI